MNIVIDLWDEIQSERHVCETSNFLSIKIMNSFCEMVDRRIALRVYSFSMYAKFSEKLTYLKP